MNTLVVHMDTTGPDPDIHAINSIGWVLLDDKLAEIRTGSALVQPWEGSIVDSKMDFVKVAATELCGQLLITEEEVLDMIEHQSREGDTMWASYDLVHNWTMYTAMLYRASRGVPRFFTNKLDLKSLSFSRVMSTGIGINNKAVGKIYDARHGGLAMSSNDSLAAAMNDAVGYKMDVVPLQLGNINDKEEDI